MYQDWPRNWLFSRQATPDSVGESGLHWLIPLWTYRDTEVRAAGFGIAVALTTTESGRITMMTQCQHIPGGIWGAAFSVLLDQAECSIVRRQVGGVAWQHGDDYTKWNHEKIIFILYRDTALAVIYKLCFLTMAFTYCIFNHI